MQIFVCVCVRACVCLCIVCAFVCVSARYQETWWLHQLANFSLEAVWQRHYFPHNYEITAFEAYLDMYVLTGDLLYLSAVEGAWGMFRDHWIHVGGSIAMNEGSPYPPDS
jgi:hypothetical protein